MSTKEYFAQHGYSCARQMKDGRWIGLSRMAYTTGLCVDLHGYGYEYRFCFEKMADAVKALLAYEGGDPEGPWIKEKGIRGERLGPGAKGIMSESGEVDGPTVLLVFCGFAVLFFVYLAATTVAKYEVFMDIKNYGCQKVVEVYNAKK